AILVQSVKLVRHQRSDQISWRQNLRRKRFEYSRESGAGNGDAGFGDGSDVGSVMVGSPLTDLCSSNFICCVRAIALSNLVAISASLTTKLTPSAGTSCLRAAIAARIRVCRGNDEHRYTI